MASDGTSPRRILVVDDEPAILRALTRVFVRAGFEVRTAGGVDEALGVLEGFTPDVVISDFKMQGRNGGELLAIVGVRFPVAKRVLLSGYAEQSDDPSILFLRKPYDVRSLVEVCR